jgi:membrane-associated protein
LETIQSFFHTIMHSEEIIQNWGLLAIILIVYIENGLFFGFFLPGDYLLFLSGVFCSTLLLKVQIVPLLIYISIAAILGSYTGYFFGKFFGEKIQNRKDSLFFKQKHLEKTQVYFEKYGPRTLIIARFLPIVRTFAPILAGIVKMSPWKFTLFNIIGGLIWVLVLVGSGYFLGQKFPTIGQYVEYIVIFFLGVTTFTVIKGFFNIKNSSK